MKVKNKKPSTKSILKYSVHLFESEQPIKNYEFIKIGELLKKTKKESVSEIFIHDLLDYYPDQDRLSLFKDVVSKIIPGGKLYIQGSDSKLLSASYLYGQIDINIFKAMMFGNNGDKRNITTISDIKNMITNMENISISEVKFINAIQYYIECYKNELC